MLNPRRHVPRAPLSEAVSGGASAAASVPPVVEPPVLDPEALRRLAELDPTGTNRLLQRVFQAFEASALRLLPQLRTALAGADHGGVRHVAHTLKSSSASIGAIKLSRLCAEIETMVRLDTLDGLAERIGEMDRETTVVLQALRQLNGVQTD